MSERTEDLLKKWARQQHAAQDAIDSPCTDALTLVTAVRARDALWRQLCDAVDADEERQRTKAEAER